MKRICTRCNKNAVNRPRGLCWVCFYTPGVKEQYQHPDPAKRKHAYCGLPSPVGEPPLPAEPTDAPPGSLAKMKVMARRFERGEAIFHPLDNRIAIAGLLEPLRGVHWSSGQPTGLEEDEGDGEQTQPPVDG